jgi:hypothetical protein
MEHRRIAIYLGDRKQVAQVQLNHLYTSKFDSILFKTGYSKTEAARKLLMLSFQTNDFDELKERIYYAANINEEVLKVADISIKRRIGEACKKALKIAIDKGYLL